MSMFCFQCEQTSKGTGCTIQGVCGKDPVTATLQDLLGYSLKGLSMYAHRLHSLGVSEKDINLFTVEGLFTTITNVNFDPARLEKLLARSYELKEKAHKLYEEACRKEGKTVEALTGPAAWVPARDRAGLVKQGEEITIKKRLDTLGHDVAGLQELIHYGLKGLSAYVDHAHVLGVEDNSVYVFIHEALDFLTHENPPLDALVTMAMRTGETNLKAMELLDKANTGRYGNPVPTQVRVEPVKGKAILVSGHDLLDLEVLLTQTEGKGINIYTHGEMLPAHGYPALKKYSHLVGNYGSAWQNQRDEFDRFPGPILMTTNCIQNPKDSYKARIFTSGLVAWPAVHHISDRNFAPVIEAALAAPGFTEEGPEHLITVGFGHEALMAAAGAIIEAVKKGDIKHFFLIGGCDGAKPGRNYFTQFAEAVPKDSVILTLACGKYRFNKMNFGDIGGIPRLVDVGQCNDAYSAIQIAVALSKAFGVGVNDLPLSMIISWYEQKAVAILLTLLHLGIRNIRLGPSLPAFVSPAVLGVLVEKFNIKPITTVEEDLNAILGAKTA
jgi:hydroxylamine reductase